MMNIAMIPARGGSKRIPRKNIKSFLGKPIIAYSIEAAKNTGCFDKIIVSTDDDEIAAVARECGAETPFIRPSNISGDHATTVEVIKHTLNWYKNSGLNVDNICCIYATSPFVTALDISEGLKAIDGPEFDYAFSVTSFPFPIQRAVKVNDGGRVEMFNSNYLNTRSQDLIEAFHDAGQFYWGKASAFLSDKPIFSPAAFAVKIPRKRVQDIDTMEDWESAELAYKLLKKSS